MTKDKIVLVSSAQNPCAQALVKGFAREGANCVVVDTDASQAEQLAAEARSLGRRALALQSDVTKKSQVEEVVRRAVAEFGRIDVLFNCSGSHEGDFSLTEEAFDQCIDRGPKACFLLARQLGGRWLRSVAVITSRPPTRGSVRANRRVTARLFQHRVDDPRHRPGPGIYGVNVNSSSAGR
jgi:NAD(P)-dependent dehydrogenase (short-subunit alcohol dehydrogenase family)